ncbi:ATP-binding protein [Alkalihalobacillus sp. MEB130]|uniref:ATP-binding protein n=1 Tax=Alkalihalobacillus sp. MEB130 TaxID=2976704 RepID=UPI0028E024F9|nr:ATP-binding protein [Alkalihalobacillus sp. MEB130]MDT8860896.1 ATP-binding protein [Alkalihalobacillus sp. MEB130]
MSRKIIQTIKKVLPVSLVIYFILYFVENLYFEIGLISVVLFSFIFFSKNDDQKKFPSNAGGIVDQLPLPVIVVENENVFDVNDAALEMFEGQSEEVIGKNISAFMFMNEGELETLVHNETTVTKITSLKGKVIDVELTKIGLSDCQGERYFFLLKDITEQKEKELKLQQAEQLSGIGQLAAGIAHEIRNPITSLKGFLQLMDSSDGRSPSPSYTKIMLSEIDRINLIVSELLILGKPKELTIKEQSLSEIIHTVVTLTNTQAIIYNIEMKVEMADELKKINVKCDENKLKQVFINVFRNAIEAMKQEGTIIIRVHVEGNFVYVSVIDQGKGIPKEKMVNIGKRFFSTKENGTGLGLMISNHIIEEHGGKITIESEEGKGTEVQISLPIHT